MPSRLRSAGSGGPKETSSAGSHAGASPMGSGQPRPTQSDDPGGSPLSPVALRPPAALYLHIPFCRRKCAYCDFSSYPLPASQYAPYVAALEREVDAVGGAWDHPALQTVYIGGGTPSLLPPDLPAGLLATVGSTWRVAVDAEVTLEANPGTVTPDALAALHAAGVNRISFGVQSFQPRLLALLGRIHSVAEARTAVEWARAAGLANLNLDLIYGLPGQTLADWQSDIEEALALEPQHLSLYSLILEEGTPLTQRVSCGEVPTPDSDLTADMYEWTCQELAARGWDHYEISNWARTLDLRSRHNLTYWHNEPYAGCGAAAYSFLAGHRRGNTPDVAAYVAAVREGRTPVVEDEAITPTLEQAETMILGLRLLAGVDRAAFAARFGQDPTTLYPAPIAECTALGLLEVTPTHLRLTARGLLLGNQVFYRFLP